MEKIVEAQKDEDETALEKRLKTQKDEAALQQILKAQKDLLPKMHEPTLREMRLRVFTKWANAMLVAKGHKPRFTDMISNLVTGVDLCLLVSALRGKEIAPRYPREMVSELPYPKLHSKSGEYISLTPPHIQSVVSRSSDQPGACSEKHP